MCKKENTLRDWNFHNSYINLPESLYSKTKPILVDNPEIFVLNKKLAKKLALDLEMLEGEMGAKILSGNLIPKGAEPISQAYAGHQFGHLTILGDGRAVLLGEHIDPKGNRFDIQLKGSGKTPYSRGGDGRAGLGPMLREYIISESMVGLKIPSTRSLAVTKTGQKIVRRKVEKAAVLTRIADSHIRVGTFEYVALKGDRELLKELADYTINRHYPEILGRENPYLELLKEVIYKQAELISKWQLVGFVHGVMNTDNMAISGQTIDYGPCAFMDTYSRSTVFSSIDRDGRYAYGNQPNIAAWNLARFGECLLALIDENQEKAVKLVEGEVSNYFKIYEELWSRGMRSKLGLFNKDIKDKQLLAELIYLMEKYKADYTNIFRDLTLGVNSHMDIYKEKEFKEWKNRWNERLSGQDQSRDQIRKLMMDNNPSIIPRNHIVEEILSEAENNNKIPMLKFLEVMSDPYSYSGGQEEYTKLPPKSSKAYRTFCGT